MAKKKTPQNTFELSCNGSIGGRIVKTEFASRYAKKGKDKIVNSYLSALSSITRRLSTEITKVMMSDPETPQTNEEFLAWKKQLLTNVITAFLEGYGASDIFARQAARHTTRNIEHRIELTNTDKIYLHEKEQALKANGNGKDN